MLDNTLSNPEYFSEILRKLPKAELHLHLEGTLTPELLFKLAKRNNIEIPYKTIEDVKKNYNFKNLQSFLDIYYLSMNVLLTEEDFHELTFAYVNSAHEQGVKHLEVFFDPQAHIERGVSFETFFTGIYEALEDGKKKFGISFFIIMNFLRHLPESEAFEVLEMSLLYKDKIIAVGLDSSEVDNPSHKFSGVFTKAISYGYLTVAHAGEEGPVSNIWDALHKLKVKRIDHGVRCSEDPELIKHLAQHQIPLTVCPLSNIKLNVFEDMETHNLRHLFENNLCVTINSDDPAFFGSLLENYIEVHTKLKFTMQEMFQIAKNSFTASFLPEEEKNYFIGLINEIIMKQ